jgi:uncharacterized protein YbaA (DUF1428 family)
MPPLPLGSNTFYSKYVTEAMNKNESSTELEETGTRLQAFLYRAPKKNHDAIVQNQKQLVPWFKNHGVRIQYYQLRSSETQGAIDSAKESGMDLLDSIAKTLSTTEEDEDVWMELQYYRDPAHADEVYAKMMQDKSIESLGNEFFGLITKGTKLVMGGFSRLSV